jgi:hypothetical protein
MNHLSVSCTVEDVLTFNKKDIQEYLRSNQQKVSGTKLELATKACNHVKLVHGLSISLEENDEQGRYNNTDDKYEIPEIADLNSGWTGDKFGIPAVTHNDVQEYLINSHHRTADKRKMKCYRQFIRGYNFFKEQYIHKIMINKIDEASPYCYIRSKCFPSMKQGLYVQWILVTKVVPFTVINGSCSCPAG